MIRNIRIDSLKLKNKNYKQSNSASIKEIKLNSKKAFEKHIESNGDYDNYISTLLSIERQYLQTNGPGTEIKPFTYHPQKV